MVPFCVTVEESAPTSTKGPGATEEEHLSQGEGTECVLAPLGCSPRHSEHTDN